MPVRPRHGALNNRKEKRIWQKQNIKQLLAAIIIAGRNSPASGAREFYSRYHGREANLSISKDKKTDKVSILSSEEGVPVVYSKKQVKELIEVLKWSLKE